MGEHQISFSPYLYPLALLASPPQEVGSRKAKAFALPIPYLPGRIDP